MNNKFSMKKFAALLGSILIGLMLATSAWAANPEPVIIEVEFVAPVTITENNALQYGLLDANMVSPQLVTITPAGVVTDASSNVLGGSQAAANLTVDATASQAINILVDNISSGAGYTMGAFRCDYNGASESSCDGTGLDIASSLGSAVVRVGATLTGIVAGASVGTFNGSFDVTVSYQ